MQASSILKSLKVLRLGRALCGDFLEAILVDAGAQVISRTGEGVAEIADQLGGFSLVVDDRGRGSEDLVGLRDALQENPGLLACRFTSFPDGGPQGHPELEDEPVMAVLGIHRMASDEPRPEPLPMPSLYAAQLAAIHIACSLLQREQKLSPGRLIEVSLFSAALSAIGRQLVNFDNVSYRDPLSYGFRFPIAQPRRCNDGRYVQPHGMFPHFVRILMLAAGHPEWADEAASGLYELPDAASVALWNERMDTIFLERDAAQWEADINAAGGACTVCRTREEWIEDDHARISGMVLPTGENGSWRPGPGMVIQTRQRTPQDPAARALRGLPSKPLAGIRVVDFCIIIAGPTGGRVLADLGADVVKVDAPNRYVNPCLWMDVNRGKRSVVLDLRDRAAREVAKQLVADADVVLENFRAGKLEQLGFGYDQLVTRQPSLIYASTNAMDLLGPWSQRPGWEHNAQAGTGMQLIRSPDGVPRHVPFPVNDYATGLFAALGVVLALLHRQRTGEGARVYGSLARSANYVQRFVGLREAPAAQSLRCADGWVSLYSRATDQPLPQGFTEMAAMRSTADVLCELKQHGRLAAVENTISELLKEPWLQDSGCIVRGEHAELGWLVQGTPHAVVDGVPQRSTQVASTPGSDAEAVLAQLGFDASKNRFLGSGSISRFPLFPN